MASIKTQGTELFFIDTISSSGAEILKLLCPTGITGLGGPADQIDDTCLDAIERTFVRGLGNPGQVSVPFIIKSPAPISHQLLFTLRDLGIDLDWLICLSDGVALPTLNMAEEFVPPMGRTSFGFVGYISDVAIDVAGNEVVRGTLTIQRSGEVTTNWVS
ncbi:MAG: phage tail tube protein [Methylococcales bacterium]